MKVFCKVVLQQFPIAFTADSNGQMHRLQPVKNTDGSFSVRWVSVQTPKESVLQHNKKQKKE